MENQKNLLCIEKDFNKTLQTFLSFLIEKKKRELLKTFNENEILSLKELLFLSKIINTKEKGIIFFVEKTFFQWNKIYNRSLKSIKIFLESLFPTNSERQKIFLSEFSNEISTEIYDFLILLIRYSIRFIHFSREPILDGNIYKYKKEVLPKVFIQKKDCNCNSFCSICQDEISFNISALRKLWDINFTN